MNSPQTILVPLDFSEPSLAALEHAVVLAKAGPAKLHLLHVVGREFPAAGAGELTPVGRVERLIELAAARAKEDLDRHATRLRRMGLEVEASVRDGRPAAEIVKTAAETKAELIVMGTHGRTGFRHLLIGSVTESVLRMAPCPVLALRPSPKIREKAA